jgi:hypothetical protein
MSIKQIVSAAALCVLASSLGFTPAVSSEQDKPYLVMSEANKVSPLLCATTSEKNLIAYFGVKNVVHETVHVAEGETTSGTIIFPKDPKRKATFIWKDAKKRDRPEAIRIEDKPSLWHLHNDITTGTSLVDLEKLNGRDFKMSGFDWDYGGNVVSWNGGKLESALKSKSGKVSATINLTPPNGRYVDNSLSGDRDILSSDKKMHKLNPVVATVSILAP